MDWILSGCCMCLLPSVLISLQFNGSHIEIQSCCCFVGVCSHGSCHPMTCVNMQAHMSALDTFWKVACVSPDVHVSVSLRSNNYHTKAMQGLHSWGIRNGSADWSVGSFMLASLMPASKLFL